MSFAIYYLQLANKKIKETKGNNGDPESEILSKKICHTTEK